MVSVGYLEQFFDPRLVLPEDATVKSFERQQIDRLGKALAIVTIAGGIPRRLGGDATREELALDKKRARRVGHALRQAFGSWAMNTPELPTGDEIKIAGAQIVWDSFVEQHVVLARAQLLEMASWAIKNDKRRWGRSVVTKIENEIKWLDYAMRS